MFQRQSGSGKIRLARLQLAVEEDIQGVAEEAN
jgi:hypothetical protein